MFLLATDNSPWMILLALGGLLTAALVGGLVAGLFRLPRVTAYLLVGMLIGPHAQKILPDWLQGWIPSIPAELLHPLEPIADLAMALVLFEIGCHFPLEHFRRILRRILRLSAGELIWTFVLVAGGLLLLPLGLSWQSAILFGALALATAPATTILVLKENESEGPVTEYATAMVAINNLVAVVLFEVIFRGVHYHFGDGQSEFLSELAGLAQDLFGSVALGIAVGLVTSFACGLLTVGSWFVLLVAMSTALLGLCGLWDIPYLLAFLAMGGTVANSSDRARSVVGELDRLTGLLCVIFFVIHGAAMNLISLFDAGLIGVAYIVLRLAGKYFGVFFNADAHHDGEQVKHWLGATLFSQAGAAIALSSAAVGTLGGIGDQLHTIILGTVVFFEITGPLFIRRAVMESGEVPLARAIHHSTTTVWEEVRAMTNRILVAMGLDPFSRRDPDQMTVSQLLLKNVKSVPAAASFDEVLTLIEESHFNVLPVVGDQMEMLGVIRFSNLRHVVFDRQVGTLVRAEDLAVPSFHVLYPDEPIRRAWQQLRHHNDDLMLVVTREEPHQLLGVIRRRDLLRRFLKSATEEQVES